MENQPKICVFAASSQSIDKRYISAAHELGTLMAQRGWTCVNGAGRTGLMQAVSDGSLDNGGRVTGVIPKFMVDNGWCYDRIPDLVITADMHERKQYMQQVTDGIVALPGGCGTLEELLEVITWRQLGIISKPIVLLNTAGFFNPLIEMLNKCVEQGFMKKSHSALWTIADTPSQAIESLAAGMSGNAPELESKY
ncbi:MAG: TIGR00730 family Rossman fold protein [Muribaculaceae bacterium]|nr:TIGR00730 family Rossman fold protein [Muribaculaceae bacterium]